MRFNLLLSNSEQKLRIITAPLWANKRGHDNGAFGHFCIFAVFFRGLPLEFSASQVTPRPITVRKRCRIFSDGI